MTAHAYTETALVEEAAIEILAALGWSTVSASDETFGPLTQLGRESRRDVLLRTPLRTALARLNPKAPQAALDRALDEFSVDRAAMDPAGANREVHRLLMQGVRVKVKHQETGEEENQTIRLVDWDDPEANELLAVRQIRIVGPLYRCIPDIVLFVNGLPWVVIELKRPGVPSRQAFDDNLTSYKHPLNGVPALFAYNAFLLASNGTESRVGSLTADWDRFFEWKRVESEEEAPRVSLETVLRGTCAPENLFDLVRNFTLFSAHKTGLAKILGQNHQFLGVNNAIRATLAARAAGHGRAGVFWQTQGSGKSFAMVFYSQKILRTLPGNWTFVVVTDRIELDDQIAKTFAACGAVADAKACHATSGSELRRLLGENHPYVFTLIHKFQSREVLCDRPDVIVMVDEAHRSQYDTLALNMRSALPRALFVAFTGTPLIAGEERTREVFGDYVSVYDFQQSVEDGATVPLYYENRTPDLELTNPDLNDEIYDVIDAAGLDDEGESRLQRLLGQQYHLITRDDRLDAVAKDIVQHFLGRGFQGKAMVVSIDKATALRTHDKVRQAWKVETDRVWDVLCNDVISMEERIQLTQRLDILRKVDMAVIVSPAQNEIEEMKKLGLDIVPHRERLLRSQPPLEEKFKDPEDPLALVFVCAMWLTGFDAPSCSTVYLDKPMRNHTLMQTIARANRVYPGKHSGVIVDYANVFASLEKALAIYGTKRTTQKPLRSKDFLAEELRAALLSLEATCAEAGVSLAELETAPNALERLIRLERACSALVVVEERSKAYRAQARFAAKLYSALKPHRDAAAFAERMATALALAEKIVEEVNPSKRDLGEVLLRIGEVLDHSIVGGDVVRDGPRPIDLSRIDFAALSARFERSETPHLDLERLKAAIRAKLDRMIAVNETRVDFREKFEELISAYNLGSLRIEQLFRELLEFTQELSEEETRHVRENLTPEEQTLFDLLTRPGPDLQPREREQVKRAVRELLPKVRASLSVDWQKTAQARARMREVIEEVLDDALPRAYTPDLFRDKTAAVFDHVYQRYPIAA